MPRPGGIRKGSTVYDFFDYSAAQFLDSLAQEYAARGYSVSYLPFAYSADWLPIAVGAREVRVIQIENDSDFILTHKAAVGFDNAGATLERPNAIIEERIDTSQRSLQNQAFHVANGFGTGPRPQTLFKPLVLSAKTSLSITAENVDAVILRLRLSYLGVKAFLAPLR